MKIAINVQTILNNKMEGLGWFSYESVKRIVQQHPEHQFLLIFSKGIVSEFLSFNNVKAINIGPPFYRPLALYLKFEYLLPYYLKKHKVDLFISTDGISSTKIKTKQLLVIHDLNFEENPQWINKSFGNYYRKYFPKWAKKANRIATVSEYSKTDINKLYGIDNSKIDVAYNGVKDVYKPISSSEQETVRREITSQKPYFVFVGALNPRKNLVGLFSAFDIYKDDSKSDSKLVIVGNKMRWTKSIQHTYEQMKYKNDIVFLGHLSPKRLNQIVASSIAMVYVSYFEGFGIPIIEAFKAETAVITSNVTSMPEVAGDAAIIIDPFNYPEIASAMLQVEKDEDLRNSLIEKGKIRAQEFSWDNTAKVIWESIIKVKK